MRILMTMALGLTLCGCASGGGTNSPSTQPAAPETDTEPGAATGTPGERAQRVVKSDVACSADTDCAPTGCCHAASCGAKSAAPSCEGVMCTMNCQPDTMDCGGRCACVEGVCAALIPPPQGEMPQ